MRRFVILILFAWHSNIVFAQGDLIDSVINKNYYSFKPIQNKHHFTGKGWELPLREIKRSNSVL